MTKLLSAASILVLAAGASAAPFRMLTYQASGGVVGGVNGGQALAVDIGGFFHSEVTPAVISGGAGSYSAANFAEFDSYFGMDSFGPTARGRGTGDDSTATRNFYGNYPAASPVPPNFGDKNTAASGLTVSPGAFIGDLSFADPVKEKQAAAGIATAVYNNGLDAFTVSGFAPNPGGGRSDLDGVFVGRFTIRTGATLSGALAVTLNDGSDQGTVAIGGTIMLDQEYALTAFEVAQVNITPVLGFAGGNLPDFSGFGPATTYDLWFHVVPTPGALALFGVGGLAALRRRRS